MKNNDESSGEVKTIEENPNSTTEADAGLNLDSSRQPSRTPFTNLSQVDADLALARTLQEQERAYMMLRMNVEEGSDYGSSDNGSYEYEGDADNPDEDDNDVSDANEDAFDVHEHADSADDNQDIESDPSAFTCDEAYARTLQDAEEREMAIHLMALVGINDLTNFTHAEDSEDHRSNSQDTWEEVDPDEMSYEELLALGEVVGTESRGLSADTIASLPSISYKAQSSQDGSTDQCVICRVDYENGDTLTLLSCKHSYHSECINNWLQINKVCPVCSTEVSTTESR